MSEMVERVARALCRQYEIDDGFSPEQADRAAASEMYKNFRKAALAAIEAMREPTEEMLQSCGNGECSKWAFGAWANMIDAALTPRETSS